LVYLFTILNNSCSLSFCRIHPVFAEANVNVTSANDIVSLQELRVVASAKDIVAFAMTIQTYTDSKTN
jgi:hypothetical protein